ncbi:hypothetical protein [Vibrio quintilis]|uniref:hypothetical protein n=1 Tax=Vibrio quintilis TaxID=1117707 RepID=UPI0013566BE1|nr:hypothetical protein [Vibrio quintilis]
MILQDIADFHLLTAQKTDELSHASLATKTISETLIQGIEHFSTDELISSG